jgi:predicted dehydrogenase
MTTRREFVKTASTVAAGALVPDILGAARFPLHSSTAATLRVGVIGCGGRGTGAAHDCMRASDGIEIVALGDVFPDRLESAKTNLAKVVAENPALTPKYKVTDARCFSGFDAYQKVLDSGVDLVILATPPAFRPQHFAAAINAGKHVFMEKPVAVDAAGVRSVLTTSEVALQKNLAVVAGTQRRHDFGYRAVIERIHGGAIGEVVSGQVYWNQGGLWMNRRKPEWTDTEWQLRNWLYFTWLSGDHIVEQHIHNIDVANWVIGAYPIRAVGIGGRQSRTDPAYGHIYDHFAVDFEYPSGARVMSMCRQIAGAANNVSERFIGTRGRTDPSKAIEGPNAWQFDPEKIDPKPVSRNPYVLEHVDLVASIRAGKPLNEGKQVAYSTLSAIMGREAAYTGQVIEWDTLLNAKQDIVPANVGFGTLKVPNVPMPGQTKLERTFESS